MNITLTRLDDVYTLDNVGLGRAHRLHFREEHEINPDAQLYAAYVEVINYEFGDVYFVPLEFFERHDVNDHRVTLSVSMKEVMNRTWTRAPEFVATGRGRRLRLTNTKNSVE